MAIFTIHRCTRVDSDGDAILCVYCGERWNRISKKKSILMDKQKIWISVTAALTHISINLYIHTIVTQKDW